jgi:hypothetical protein
MKCCHVVHVALYYIRYYTPSSLCVMLLHEELPCKRIFLEIIPFSCSFYSANTTRGLKARERCMKGEDDEMTSLSTAAALSTINYS